MNISIAIDKAIIVPSIHVRKKEGYGTVIRQLISLHVRTALRKSKRKNFHVAVIEMFKDGRRTKIHLDDEIRFELSFKNSAIKSEDEGKMVAVDLKNIKDIKLTEERLSPDSAKAFIIKWSTDFWVLHYDFRYDKESVRRSLSLLAEYLDVIRKLDLEKNANVSVYLIWSSLELLFDAKYKLLPLQQILSHDERRKKADELYQSHDLFSNEFVQAFHCFTKAKKIARYAEKASSTFTKQFNKNYLNQVIKMIRMEMNKDSLFAGI